MYLVEFTTCDLNIFILLQGGQKKCRKRGKTTHLLYEHIHHIKTHEMEELKEAATENHNEKKTRR